MKISNKLIVLVTIPLIAFLTISIVYIKISIDESRIVDGMTKNTKLFVAVSDLVHELQKERGRTSIYLSGGSLDDMNTQRKTSTNQVSPVINELKTAKVSESTKNSTSQAISEIDKIRNRADSKGSTKEIFDAYGQIIATLMATETAIANSMSTSMEY